MLSSKLVSALKQFHRPVHSVAAMCQKIQDAPIPHRIEKTLNQVTLLGRVGGEPQKRGTEQHPVVIFSLATHTNFRDEAGDFSQKTDWHRICIFKPSLRESVYNYLHKGQRVYVTGRITYGEIKDEGGNTRSATSIVAEDVIFFQANE